MMKWLFEPVPKGRVAIFRSAAYLFVALDLVIFTPWVKDHAHADPVLYQPLWVARVLHLPTPTPLLINTIFWVLLVVSVAALSNKAPRLLGWAVFALYLEWMIIAMSYGKVDHDRFAFLVALAVLPTVSHGRGRLASVPAGNAGQPPGPRDLLLRPLGLLGAARWGDRTPSEKAGWALRMVQIGVVATYFLASWAKLRYGGPDWMTGSVLARAILRRGTDLAHWIAPIPGALIGAQIGIMVFELTSPLIFFLPERWRLRAVAFFYSFHLVTIATITISFAPHLVAMLSFLPLERLIKRSSESEKAFNGAPTPSSPAPPGEPALARNEQTSA